MKKAFKLVCSAVICAAIGMMSGSVWAVPAYRGWQERTLADGTTVTVRQNGDEFFHYWETADGQLAIEQADGSFVLSNQALPTREQVRAKRTKAPMFRQPKAIGTTPNLAPRGVVILVNFSDSKLKNAHTLSVFDDMCNSENCSTNKYYGVNYGSAATYFSDQSNGSYRPIFDVFGPVTLSHSTAYYGEQGMKTINGEEELQNDLYMADFVIDAVLAADAQGCDFSQYDSDDDGWVDFVYFIYAGKGQAAGGSSETIWPHNWDLNSALYWGFTHGNSGYAVSDQEWNPLGVDGVYISNYACSAELDYGGDLGGIGTLCHEFGHVMGLPDLYDTEYGYNYNHELTPGSWDIMDAGSYNGNGHCPPNYDPWEKYFFGWVTPFNPGNKGTNGTLNANGTEDYNVFQINSSGTLTGATEEGLSYYLENRQQSGWDSYIPAHGMVVWRVDFDADLWTSNAPNNTENDPHLTVSTATNTWEEVSGKPVTDIKEKNGVVTFKYKGGAQEGDENWFYYDDGTYATSIGTNGSTFYWGIMFPAGSIQGNDPHLTHIALIELAEYNTQPINIAIYNGAAPQEVNKIHAQTAAAEGNNTWHVIAMDSAISIAKNKDLWIILSEGTDTYPAATSNDTGDANGRWVSTDGINWFDLASSNLNYTFMLRAYITFAEEQNPGEGLESVESEESRAESGKILMNGQLFILHNGKMYDAQGRLLN